MSYIIVKSVSKIVNKKTQDIRRRNEHIVQNASYFSFHIVTYNISIVGTLHAYNARAISDYFCNSVNIILGHIIIDTH